MFSNMDLGPSGGDYDGFVRWTSQGSDDGTIPRRSFAITVGSGDAKQTHNLTPYAQKGILLDTRRLKIGWEKNDTTMPKPHRVMVPAGTAFPASPGEGYKKALSVPVSIGDGREFLWEQGGVTAFSALEHLVPQLAAGEASNPGKVPHVQMVGTIEMTIQGKALGAPKFALVGWVDPSPHFKAVASSFAGMAPAAPVAGVFGAPAAAPAPSSFGHTAPVPAQHGGSMTGTGFGHPPAAAPAPAQGFAAAPAYAPQPGGLAAQATPQAPAGGFHAAPPTVPGGPIGGAAEF